MRSSFVRDLFAGIPYLGSSDKFPLLGAGRSQQLEPLLTQLRQRQQASSALELLQEAELLVRPLDWPPAVLARVVQELAGVDVSAALSWIVHLSLGLRLAQGVRSTSKWQEILHHPAPLFAFALTEENPGSDISQIQTYAEQVPGGYRLTGRKSWVTNACAATHFLIVARSTRPQAGSRPGLTVFLVERDAGVQVQAVESDVLPRAHVGQVLLEDVWVPEAHLVGAPGKGFRYVMQGLSEARLLQAAAVTGSCQRAFNDVTERLESRRAFGRAVSHFPSVHDRTASMLADILALESLVYAVSGFAPLRSRIDPVERAVVRLSASQTAGRVLDAARELFGAAAFAGPATAAHRWIDTQALTLLDGSDLALQSYIALEGTREIRKRLRSLADPTEGFARWDAWGQQLWSQARGRFQYQLAKNEPGLSPASFSALARSLGERVQAELRDFGAEFVERQHVHRRLANSVTELSVWQALSSRVMTSKSSRGVVGSQRMQDVAEVWVRAAEQRIRAQLEGCEENDDALRDRIALRMDVDGSYPFDVMA